MSKNKNYQKRITILGKCFSSRTGLCTFDRIIEVVYENLGETVFRRVIQNDIKSIEELVEKYLSKNENLELCPVFQNKLFDGKKKEFRYSKVAYGLGNQLLSKSDKDYQFSFG